jgi:16S rRNA C1402 (ribose-2'-O) methylase RsmI
VDVAQRLTEHLASVPRRPQMIAYLSDTRGDRLVGDPGAVLDDLARHAARTVQ